MKCREFKSQVFFLFFLLFLPVQVWAQCAIWNDSVDPGTGEILNTIEAPPGTVIGFANPTTSRAESFEGVPLSAQGLACIVRDGQVYDPDDLSTPAGREPADNDGSPPTIPEICAVAPGLPACQNQPPPNDDGGGGGGIPFPPIGGGGGGGGGGAGGGGGGGGGPLGGGSPKSGPPVQPPVTQDSTKITVPQQNGKAGPSGGDGGQLVVAAADLNDCKDKKRSCPHTRTEMSLDLSDGQRRLPILISSRDMKRSMLNFISGDGSKEKGGERPALGKIFGFTDHKTIPAAANISTDNEVLRTSMAVFQPDRRRRMDFLNDVNSRDMYLDSALTLRGVTVMAMGFLDKTLGAGLHAIDEQSANQLQNDMLKQIGWTTTRLSNDDRAQALRDIDEKVEACLEEALEKGAGPKSVTNDTTRKRVWYQCSQECGKAPKADKKYRVTSDPRLKKAGNGTYAYCVCCAEASVNLNKLSEGERKASGLEEAANTQLWTLSERAFYGVMPEESQDLSERVETFKILFGDVVLRPDQGGASPQSAPEEGKKDPYFIYVTQFPKASPQKIVSMYKNKCFHTQGGSVASDLGQFGECNLEEDTRFGVTCGICPGLVAVLSRWSEFNGTAIAAAGSKAPCQGSPGKVYAQATLGSSLTMRQIKEFLALNGDRAANLKSGDEKQLIATVIEAWCESSAVAAAARLYSVEKALAMDHMIASNLLTEQEKGQFLRLVERYGEYFNLAQLDANSRLAALAINTGMSILYDRWGAATQASAQNVAYGAGNRDATVAYGGASYSGISSSGSPGDSSEIAN